MWSISSRGLDRDFRKASRLLKNAHLLRFPHPSSLRRTSKYASFLRMSGALHLGIFEQPERQLFFQELASAEISLSVSVSVGVDRNK